MLTCMQTHTEKHREGETKELYKRMWMKLTLSRKVQFESVSNSFSFIIFMVREIDETIHQKTGKDQLRR